MSRINRFLWLAFAAWCITLFILSSIPGNRIGPPPFFEADKVVHTIIFATGSFLLALAFYRTFGHSLLKTSLLVFLAMVFIGVGDEFHQTYTPGRSGDDPGDLLADAVGALIGISCARFLHGRRSAKPHSPAPGGDRSA
ncbi:MAG TPA: VanZ family protein [Chthoniobacterales bacterium]|nr:VanZ family protein [Chthoniobacterales bacterium]